MPEEKKRIFIAINLPNEIKQDLVHYISKIKKINSNRNFKYVKPEALHITLHYLGYLTLRQIDKVKIMLPEVINDIVKFSLTTDTLSYFPNSNRPRTVYINCVGDIQKASELQKDIGIGIQQLKLAIDKRKWQTHITICRIKKNEKFTEPDFKTPQLEFKVNTIELMKSKLTPQGAEYTVLESYDLK